MSYPRNAASPPRISIGPVVQISDGTVQTSGVSIKIKPEGGAASAGSGTTSYEEGIVAYVPTQAETDYTAFQVIAYKTGCIPAAVTIVTTASATAGKVVLSGETHTSAVIPTVTTLTNAPSDSSGVTTLLTRIVGTLASGTHQPQTGDGYALAANVTYGLAALKALIDAISSKTTNLPSDPADASDIAAAFGAVNSTLAIIAGYIDTEVTAIKAKTDNLPATPASTTDIPSAAEIADAVWDEVMSGHTTDGTYGGRIVRATNSNVSVQITGSNHVAADVHELQAGVIESGDFATDAIAAACVSAGAANKIADHVRRRTQGNVEASSDGDTLSVGSLYGFIQQAQESNTTETPGYLTIKKTDGSTTLGTKAITSNASADPITGIG